jgi:hypothetical protein
VKVGNGGQTVLGRNLEASAEAVRSWTDQASGGNDAAAALADRVASLTSTADGKAGDLALRATVASSGNLTGLEIDGAPELAGEILRTVRRAQAGLVDRVADAVAETVGADSETGRAVLDSFAQRFPIVPPDEPVMPAPTFPTFQSRATLPHQSPGGGFESGRDSRAR